MISLYLPHKIDTDGTGWLSYSHDHENPPSDRQVIHGNSIIRPAGVQMASWYFLSDAALQVLQGSEYLLVTVSSYEEKWLLMIKKSSSAAMFKLKWM